ncbi:MAG: tetratricopeptide repeat protein [Gammaproteobacteria bacterium]|nr:tetratricopeptide repeat protein [Gammaproteobacteria bacterium]
MQQAMIVDVTINNFQEMVMQHSKQRPVVAYFWSHNNEQSRQDITTLEKLAHEMAGKFILAKINYDQQSDLVQKLSVPVPPFYKLIVEGDIKTEGPGGLPEDAYRSMLNANLTIDPSEDLRKQAAQAFAQGHSDEAVALLGQAAQVNPNNFKIHLDLVQLYLHSQQIEMAKELFSKLPDKAKADPQGEFIEGLLYFSELIEGAGEVPEIQAILAEEPNNIPALFQLTGYLVLNHKMENALQTLFKIFTLDRAYQEGLPQKTIIRIFNMLKSTEPELVNTYRRKFQSLLY